MISTHELHRASLALIVLIGSYLLAQPLATLLEPFVPIGDSALDGTMRALRTVHAIGYGILALASAIAIRSAVHRASLASTGRPQLRLLTRILGQVAQYVTAFFFAGIALQNLTTRSVTISTLSLDANYIGTLVGPIVAITLDGLWDEPTEED